MAISETIPIPDLPFQQSSNPKPFKSTSNPRILGFQSEADMLIDRFRVLLKDREEKLKISDEEDDVSEVYEIVLRELTFNSKPIITELTMIAEEYKDYAEGIANAVCNQIIEVPIEQKLPSLYLLDSIAKNVGFEYVEYLAKRLPEVFCHTYKQVQSTQHCAMRHLFGTWSTVFPTSVLEKIGSELKLFPLENHQSLLSASSEFPSPLPTDDMHVNPKNLDTRHQFEHSTVEVKHAERISSHLQKYGQKPHFGHDECNIHQTDAISNQVRIQRSGSPGRVACTSVGRAEMTISSKTKPLTPSSPSRAGSAESLSPSGEGSLADSSLRRAIEKTSPYQCRFQNQPRRVNKRYVERSDWWKTHSFDRNNRYTETYNACHLNNGYDLERPRALIAAYGAHREENNLNEKPPMIEQFNINGINREVAATRSWQNTKGKHYASVDMSRPLAGRSMNNDAMVSKVPHPNLSTRMGSGEPVSLLSEPNTRIGHWHRNAQLPKVDGSATIAEDGLSKSGGAMGNASVFSIGTRTEATQIQGSHHFQGPWSLQQNISQALHQHNPEASVKAVQTSVLQTGTILPGQRLPFMMDNLEVLSSMEPAAVDKHLQKRACSPPITQHILPQVNVHKSHQPFPLPTIPQQNQIDCQFDLLNADKQIINQGPNVSSLLPQQQFTAIEVNTSDSATELLLPHHLERLTSENDRGQGQAAPSTPQALKCHEIQSSVPQILAQVSANVETQPSNHGYPVQRHRPVTDPTLNNQPGISSPIHTMSSTSFQSQCVPLPPLPPGALVASQTRSSLQDMDPIACHPPSKNLVPIASHPSAVSAFSDLISSLMAHGLISLTKPVPLQDSVGVEFKTDLLKVRHEFVIKSLYADLQRQCTTCGLRFKCQEDHRTHMDWHVVKNRASKNRKHKPSRNWFVSSSIWLSSGEALGSDAVPGFLTETVVEKTDDEEVAVLADEYQKTCALCGESFDEFFSDDTEEWMCRGAVYLNALDRSSGHADRSQLGPIVHAKCRPGSTSVLPDDFGLNEWEKTEESRQTKRLRV